MPAYKRPIYPLQPAWISQSEMEARIEAVRAVEPPRCIACGHISTDRRRCTLCRQVKPVHSGFNRDRSKSLGRRYTCIACDRVRNVAIYAQRKRRAFRAILEAV